MADKCCAAIVKMYNASVFRILLPCAEVAKSVDAVDSKSTAFGHAGSIPAFGTIAFCNVKNNLLRRSNS